MKPIAIPRPDDPDGQALWDEAKRVLLTRPDPCLCGKRTTCACRMRLPVVDEASEEQGDE